MMETDTYAIFETEKLGTEVNTITFVDKKVLGDTEKANSIDLPAEYDHFQSEEIHWDPSEYSKRMLVFFMYKKGA